MSVIVPTYADRALRLQSALASIWAQVGLGEQFDVEPIVVDNGSSGPTEEVVRRFPGTRYVRLDSNRGPAGARNAGLREATGHYVAFLDDDDLWLPRRLSIQVPVLELAEDVEVAYSQFINVQNDGTFVVPGPDAPSGWIFEAVFRAFGKGFIVHVPTILIPRPAFETVGEFDEGMWLGDDTDMWLRLALHFPFRFIPGNVALYEKSMRWTKTWHDDTTRSWLMRRDKVLALLQGKPNEAELRQLVRSGTKVHLVQISLLAGNLAEARRRLLKALEVHPMLTRDGEYELRIREMTLEIALADDSLEATRSLCADVKRTGPRGSLRHRLMTRAFLADIWTRVAMAQASGRHDRTAGAAAAKALLQNPLKALSRPGLLRLLARAMVVTLTSNRRGRPAPEASAPPPGESDADRSASEHTA